MLAFPRFHTYRKLPHGVDNGLGPVEDVHDVIDVDELEYRPPREPSS